MEKLVVWFLIFMAYAFLGWVIEVINGIVLRRKAVNRGFLVGPICPIWGVGGLLLSLLLPANEHALATFCVAFVGAAILEYITSYVMEKLFRVRWWDYSERPMNLNGRICLEALVAFGFIGVFIVKIFTPALIEFYDSIPTFVIYIIAGGLFTVLLIDVGVSLWLVLGVRVTVGTVQKDATSEISERVHEILTGKGRLNRRLIKAFPNQSPSEKRPGQKH